jgi:NADPH:quinone reductase-like Zn-dependent oxidoreductase
MRAVTIEDGELRWLERADPVPGDTELLVTVHAAGLNGADLVQVKGFYPAPPGAPPDIPGMELAGEVVAVGRQVTKHAVGDRVMGLVGGGAQATIAVVDESHALPVPATLSWPEAGGFCEVFCTAFDALWNQGAIAMGDRVLVTGAAGGVGTAGVQLAAATGAVVVASVRDPARRAVVAALGADEVVDPTDVAAHGPYDLVLELVGAAGFADAVGALATGGRIVVIGVGSGAAVELDLYELMRRRAVVRGSTLRARTRAEKATVISGVGAHVLPALAAGRVRVPVSATMPMADAPAAYRAFADGHKLGKIVLVA